ncbi:MAG: hypothetical protein HY800_03240, partial [Ignavibacteriales bacterium]|nr:hypothetical protein [Ignavibacteriales bacterium]
MKRISPLAILWFTCFVFAPGQEQRTLKDSTAMPKLEIPEITIVGKKAITLPFARKGEIYDVNLYEAPPPDTTLLKHEHMASLPIGALPRYEEPFLPWHFSAEGSIGSFSTGHLRALVDYKGRKWGIYGNSGFRMTNGHTDHSSGNSFFIQTTAHSLVSTDNEILGAFRVSGGFQFIHDKYGMFGIRSISIDRSRNNVILNTRLASLEREKNSLELDLSADILSITDKHPSVDYKSSAVSPKLSAYYGTQIEEVRISTQIVYESSSLNYDYPTQTPSLFKFGIGGQWQLVEKWFLDVGGNYFGGSASDGGTNSMLLPFASIKWQLARDREASFWFKPEMSLKSYGTFSKRN